MKEIFASRGDSDVIEVEAFLSKNQYQMIQNGEADVEIPSGTEMINKAGSRHLTFTCYGKKAALELIDGLDASSIEWQEEYSINEAFSGGRENRDFSPLYKDESSLDKREDE